MSFLKQLKNRKAEQSSIVHETYEKKFDRIKARAQMQREAKVKKQGLKPSYELIRREWAFNLRIRDMPKMIYTDKEMFALYVTLKKMAGQNIPHRKFLSWCFKNWTVIRALRFRWMRENRPDYPTPGFFVKFIQIFLESWMQREELLAMSKMTFRERMVAGLVKTGYDQETAELEVTKRIGAGVVRAKEKLQKTRDAIEAQSNLEKKRKRALLQSAPKSKPQYGFKPTKGSFGVWK